MRLFPIAFFICFISFGQKTTSTDQKRDFIIQFGLNSYFEGDTLGLNESNKQLKEIYDTQKDSFSLAKALHFKALIYRIQYRLDSSYYYYHQSKNISKEIKDSLEVGRRMLSMANMQNDERDYTGAEITIIEGLRYLEPLEEYTFTPHSLVTLGNVLTSLSRFSEARKYYTKASSLYEKNSSLKLKNKEQLNVLNNIGNTFLLESKPEEALEYLKKGLQKDSIKEKYLWHYKRLLGNIADCKYMLNKKEEAWKDLKKLLKIREKEEDEFGLSLSHNGFAYYYQLEEKKTKALFHAKKGYELAKRVNNNATRLSALLKLGELASGNTSKQYYQEYAQLSDSLNNRERYYKNQFANVRYETEKKDKENADLKQENQLKAQEAENQRQQKIILGLLAIILLVFSATYYRNRRKKMLYEGQLQKASAREEERQQIAKSLHDEVAGDLRMIHQKLLQNNIDEAKNVESIKENVRNLSHQLSSVNFEEVSFKDQIINLISDAFSPGFRITTEGIDTIPWKEINSTIKRTLYLCVRESLQNTMKYAEASKFSIVFSQEKKEVQISLKDNGKGFDEGKLSKGIGLKNLKERVEEIRGFFDIESSKEGTKTKISIPIHG
tara:strand:- start:34511 stop:36340 length:1830 start_codon:yes stop_codon:yes gene_type:complete